MSSLDGLESTGGLPATAEEWHRFLLDRLPLGIATVDHQRRVTYLNHHASELTGWGAEEAVGRSCGEVLQGGHCSAECPLLSVLSRRRETVDMRSTLTDRWGRTIPIAFRTVALFRGEELVGAVEAFHDISTTVALEEERKRTLSYFAHDMKSPLVGALGLLQRLMDGKAGELSPKQSGYVSRVLADLQRVQELVVDYLDVLRLGSREVSLNLEPLDLVVFLERLAGFYRPRAEDKGLAWAQEVACQLPLVMADRRRLERALSNILDNAVKFSRNGEVRLDCAPVTGNWVRLLVCDRGPGLSEDDQERIFSPFFRGSAGREVEGTGLGLAAAQTIVQSHGGGIYASNRADGGACFSVLLPIVREDAPRDEA